MPSSDRRPTGAAWPQTESLLLLRQVMGLAGEVRSSIAARADLTPTELHALEHLTNARMGPGELARRLDVSTAASTGIVDRLEAKGHVARRAHPGDRRRTDVVVTESARAEVMGHLGPMFRVIAQADAELTEDERAVVVCYLRAAVAAAHAVTGADAPADAANAEQSGPEAATASADPA